MIALNPTDLRGVFADIRGAAEALQAVIAGERLVLSMQEGFATIERAVRDRARTPGVVCLEWLDPLMAAGNWMPEIVRIAGGEERIGVEGAHSPWIAWEDLAEADPDVILMIPCGFSIARTVGDLESVAQRREWQALRAVRSAAVFVGDGNQYFNRPGPRLVESARIVAEIFHPKIVPARHRGVGWTVPSRSVIAT